MRENEKRMRRYTKIKGMDNINTYTNHSLKGGNAYILIHIWLLAHKFDSLVVLVADVCTTANQSTMKFVKTTVCCNDRITKYQ